MIDFEKLAIGDFVHVEYGKGRDEGCTVTGKITRIWTPEEHSARTWQAQINNRWCFHASDNLFMHARAAPAETE